MRKLDHCNIVRLRYFFYSSGEKVRVAEGDRCSLVNMTSHNVLTCDCYTFGFVSVIDGLIFFLGDAVAMTLPVLLTWP